MSAHDLVAAATKPEQRDERIDALTRQADQWTGKLSARDEGVKHRSRKRSEGGAKPRFHLAARAKRTGRASSITACA